jgi:hypothetical protein
MTSVPRLQGKVACKSEAKKNAAFWGIIVSGSFLGHKIPCSDTCTCIYLKTTSTWDRCYDFLNIFA